jgi:hypothetical protein
VFKGRVESKFTLTSDASVSVTIPNGAGATSVKVLPKGSYYWTAAGTVSGAIETIEDALNAEHAVMGFPRTAAAVAAAIGYGTWTNGAGYLFQEASGNPAAVFGSPASLTASGAPTYQNDGIRTGDLAIGFDGTATLAGGTGDFDADDSTDLIFGFVFNLSADLADTNVNRIVHKRGSGAGYTLYMNRTSSSNAGVNFLLRDGSANTVFVTTDLDWSENTDTWFAGLAVVDRATDVAQIAIQNLSTGAQHISTSTSISSVGSMSNSEAFSVGSSSAQPWYLSALYAVSGSGVATGLSAGISTALTNFAAAINASWSVSLDTTNGTGRVSIGWSGYDTPTWSLSWTSTDLRDALGFDANISSVTTTQTGDAAAKFLWIPNSPLHCDQHPSMAPEATDLRTSESPTGVAFGLSGTQKYVHTGLGWDHVDVERIREGSATYDNQSLEVFFRDTQSGQGTHSWCAPASPLQVWWNNAGTETLLGDDANDGSGVDGWTLTGVSRFSDVAKPSQPGWVGAWNVTFPRLVSDG